MAMGMTFGKSSIALVPNHAKLLEGYKRDCKIRKIRTADQYWRAIKRYLSWVEEHGIDPLAIKKSDLKDYLLHLREERRLIHRSLETEFTRLSDFYSYLVGDEILDFNPVPEFRKRNIRAYKADSESQQRQIISVMDAAKIVSSTLETRDRAIILLLLKTGMRCHELCELDLYDIDLDKLTVTVKPTPKRSNRELYFDRETAETLDFGSACDLQEKAQVNPHCLSLTKGGESNIVKWREQS
jgi:integrase/recombinase XerD